MTTNWRPSGAADTKRVVLLVEARQYRFLEQEFVVPASGEHIWTLEEMQTLLTRQGLHVVTAADKAVLDAVRECYAADPGALPECVWRAHANVVLARREAEKEKTK